MTPRDHEQGRQHVVRCLHTTVGRHARQDKLDGLSDVSSEDLCLLGWVHPGLKNGRPLAAELVERDTQPLGDQRLVETRLKIHADSLAADGLASQRCRSDLSRRTRPVAAGGTLTGGVRLERLAGMASGDVRIRLTSADVDMLIEALDALEY